MIKLFEQWVNEKKEEGLIFNPSSQKDLNKMRKALEDSDLYAEFDKKEGYFLFPEESDRYDELEAEIEELTRLHDISGYIESIDINEGVGIWPQSKLSVIFQFNLDEELKKLKKGRFYVIGYDLYHNDKKILTIDPDKDGVYKIVDKVKRIKLQ